MAELNNTGNTGARPRSKKRSSRVDLTAMVDLAFLLITFFMLTTSLTKPQSMSLSMPENGKPAKVDENRTMSILIGDKNHLKYYMGLLNETTPKNIVYGNGLRKEIMRYKKEALAYSAAKGHPNQGLIVLIKPSKKSSYRNLVDVLDEMAISDVPSYAITDIQPEEVLLLEKESPLSATVQ
jgi:biopolymer transport protein ExbD